MRKIHAMNAHVDEARGAYAKAAEAHWVAVKHAAEAEEVAAKAAPVAAAAAGGHHDAR